METLEEQILPGLEEQLMSSRPEFPASRRVWPGSEEARRMTAGSGRQCSMWLALSDPLGLFSKILLGSSHWGNSMEFCYVWGRLDTRYGLSAFQLTPWEQSTDGSGSSLWQTPVTTDAMAPHSQEDLDKERSWRPPAEGRQGRSRPNNLRDQAAVSGGLRLWRTPNASDVTGGPMDGEKRLAQGHHLNLVEQAATPKLWPAPMAEYSGRTEDRWQVFEGEKRGGAMDLQRAAKLWPTPNAGNFNDGESLETWETRREANKAKGINGNGQGTPLAIAAKLWPAPQTHDAAKGNPERVGRFGTAHGGRNLNDEMGGSLNPEFVEALMGFPIGHTRLLKDESLTGHTDLKRSETQSCPSRSTPSLKPSRRSLKKLLKEIEEMEIVEEPRLEPAREPDPWAVELAV